MENKIIEVFDYLGDKIGLAIDWSAANVYPQLLDFMARYKAYEIITDVAWLLFLTAIVVGICWTVFKRIIPAYNLCRTECKSNSFFTWSSLFGVEWSGLSIACTGISIIVGMVTIFEIPCIVSDLIKWFVIPEVQFYDIVKNLIK